MPSLACREGENQLGRVSRSEKPWLEEMKPSAKAARPTEKQRKDGWMCDAKEGKQDEPGGQVGLAHSRSFDAQRCALAPHGEIVLRALCRNGGSDSSVASIGVNRRRPVQMQPDESIAAQRFRWSRQRSAGPAQQSGQRRQRQRQRQTSEVHAWRRCVQVQVAVVGSGAGCQKGEEEKRAREVGVELPWFLEPCIRQMKAKETTRHPPPEPLAKCFFFRQPSRRRLRQALRSPFYFALQAYGPYIDSTISSVLLMECRHECVGLQGRKKGFMQNCLGALQRPRHQSAAEVGPKVQKLGSSSNSLGSPVAPSRRSSQTVDEEWTKPYNYSSSGAFRWGRSKHVAKIQRSIRVEGRHASVTEEGSAEHLDLKPRSGKVTCGAWASRAAQLQPLVERNCWKLVAAAALERRGDHPQQHIHQSSSTQHARSTGAQHEEEEEDEAAHKSACLRTSLFISLGRRALLHIIARKLHSAGRGPSATTTSPSAASPSATALSTLDATALLQSGDVHPPLVSSAAQDGALDTEAVPAVRPPSVSTDTISNDLAASLSAFANPATPIAADVLLPSAPPQNLDATTGSMLDAQAIQAQVEALIHSTSSAVADKAVVSQPPSIPSLPPASLLPAPLPQPLPAVHAVLEAAPQPDTRSSLQQSTTASAADTPDAAALRATSASRPNIASGAGFENTFAQYQFPQSADRALNMSGRNAEAEGAHLDGTQSPPTAANNGKQRVNTAMFELTREEEEKAADALIADIDAPAAATGTSQRVKAEAFSGADLAAAAKAIGLEADADLLGGMDQDQRALAAAIRRLGDEHGEAAQKAIQQAAAAAAAAAAARASHAAAARASQELARAAAREQRSDEKMPHRAPDLARSSTPSVSSLVIIASTFGPIEAVPMPEMRQGVCTSLQPQHASFDARPGPESVQAVRFAPTRAANRKAGAPSVANTTFSVMSPASTRTRRSQASTAIRRRWLAGDTGGLVSLGLGTPGKKFRCNNCGRSFVSQGRTQSPPMRWERQSLGSPVRIAIQLHVCNLGVAAAERLAKHGRW
ncbi:hypothetical protein L1887_50713 [Cichorium endivia]|nr:hypothetical protein L1887_50713 [Cichorium endivia]